VDSAAEMGLSLRLDSGYSVARITNSKMRHNRRILYSYGGNGVGAMASHVKQHEQGRGTHLADYWPLISLIVLTLLAAGALASRSQRDAVYALFHGPVSGHLLHVQDL
jgi:hypothetical protein